MIQAAGPPNSESTWQVVVLCRYLPNPKQLLRFCQGNHQVEQHGDDSVATKWPNLQEAGSRQGQRFHEERVDPGVQDIKATYRAQSMESRGRLSRAVPRSGPPGRLQDSEPF